MTKRNVTILLALLIVLTVFVCIAGCASTPDRSGNREITSPTDFGNGVLYFQGNHGVFGDSLSEYIKDHPDMRIVSTAPDTFGNGYIIGYFVVVEKRS